MQNNVGFKVQIMARE